MATRYMIRKKNLSVDSIIDTPEETLSQWISTVNSPDKKAKHIKDLTNILKYKY